MIKSLPHPWRMNWRGQNFNKHLTVILYTLFQKKMTVLKPMSSYRQKPFGHFFGAPYNMCTAIKTGSDSNIMPLDEN